MVQGLRAGVRIFGRREARKYPPTKQEGAQLMGVGMESDEEEEIPETLN